MEEKKRKPITNHVLILTSDAQDAGVKQFRIRTWIVGLAVILLCAVFGALIGYFVYEENIWQEAIERSNAQGRAMEQLQEENTRVKEEMEAKELELQEEIQMLKDEVQLLSTTLNEKVESEKQLNEELANFYLPTGFPLNGSAASFEVTEGEKPNAKIVTSEGVMVVAAAKGTVIAVNDDMEYGHNIWVDHGNGYVTIYRNQADPVVKQGDVVFAGTTLYVIGEKNTELGYQIMLNGEYVNPMDIINIKG